MGTHLRDRGAGQVDTEICLDERRGPAGGGGPACPWWAWGSWGGGRTRAPSVGQSSGDPSVLLTIPSVKVNIQGQRKAALTHIYIKNKSLNYLSSFAWGLILCPCSTAQYICPDKELQAVGLRVWGCKKYRCQINWLWHSAAD